MTEPLPRRPFGRTGHDSSRLIFGAAALMADNDKVSGRALELLLEHGVNHIDVAASYGLAEQAVGRWMAEHREHFFLASKTDERSYEGARDQIHRSLERLRCDRLDLIQLHNLTQPDDHARAFGDDGVLRAAVEARDAGLVRFIGVTGHGTQAPAMHLASLERFRFDSVLVPVNRPMLAQPDYAADLERLTAECDARGVAVQTIKAVAQRRWRADEQRQRRCWYAPLEEPVAFASAVGFVLEHESLFLNTSSDLTIFERTLAAARAWFDTREPTDSRALDDALASAGAEPLFVPGLDDVGPAPA